MHGGLHNRQMHSAKLVDTHCLMYFLPTNQLYFTKRSRICQQ
jgi:hypothetical protein